LKTFKENFTPIEITVINLEGEEFVLKSNFMNASIIKAIEKINNDENILFTDKIFQMCKLIFGKDEAFFEQFSVSLLAEASKYVQEKQKKK
jgi:hypothetical protein